MTEMERNRVVELQHQGYGYKKISTLTGLPLNTVKSFCTRHPVRCEDIAEQQGLCRNCLKQLEQTAHVRNAAPRWTAAVASARMPAVWRGGMLTPKK